MGTFHDNLGELHGITIAVDTTDDRICVGRCHEANDRFVLLLDADVHHEGDDGLTKCEWLKRAAKWGVFPRHKSLQLPRDQVAAITRLGEVAQGKKQ